jgi:hypothetical protein
MEVTMRLPNDIYESLKSRWDDVPRHALEALAAEAYRSGALTETQVKRLLGFETRFQVHALLKEQRAVALSHFDRPDRPSSGCPPAFTDLFCMFLRFPIVLWWYPEQSAPCRTNQWFSAHMPASV